jgi:polygalacturonase
MKAFRSLLASSWFILAWAASLPAAEPAQPRIPERVFNLSDFGANPDGKTSNTDAFRRAIAAVDKAGGGTLVVPEGKYFTGPVDLCSRLNLRLETGATILFSPDPAAYRAGDRFRPLLQASSAHDVTLSGTGTIDGSGAAWWDEAQRFKAEARAKGAKSDTSPRPRMVVFDRCQRVRVEGVTLTNAPVFNLVPSRCEDVTVDGITILNPADSPNTDGIDPSLTQRMLITHCLIDTGDDCIAIKSGGQAGTGVRDLLIENCTFLHGHGCSIGSETSGSVRNVTVRNCIFDGTTVGVRFKSDRTRGGVVEQIVYENLTMKNVGQAIVISSYYPERTMPKPGQHAELQLLGATTPVWRDIIVRNVTATACTKSAGVILGLPEAPVTGLTLENVRIEAPEGLRLGYAKEVTLRGLSVTAAQGAPLLVEDTVVGLKKSE